MQQLGKTYRNGLVWRAAAPGGKAARRRHEPKAETDRSGNEIRTVPAPGGAAFVEVACRADDRVSEGRGFRKRRVNAKPDEVALCPRDAAERLVRFDHHRVLVRGKPGVMLTYHWVPLEERKNRCGYTSPTVTRRRIRPPRRRFRR